MVRRERRSSVGGHLLLPLDERAGRKIIRADATLRTVTLISVAVALVLGSIAFVYAESFLRDMKELAQESPSQAVARVGLVLKVLAVGMSVIPVAVGAYLGRVAVLTWRSGEFPPPGTRVLRDTAVTTGPGSRRWAMVALILALVLLAGGILIPLVTWNLVESLLYSAPGPGGV
ncbi:MAG: hypothetical protein GTN78_19765 [Gemmatimonadales bacterium]|nr:hypothetical protein [Gemmatimonadales bacterium]NIN12611.1 hypothetical protein [Gemmatimonadales bacterium]NIR02404.1 hypothetical protein [Gemmatimonadales bacterium]NIS66195.1 hypothetical protein [Gemmatimonadales bacterium]